MPLWGFRAVEVSVQEGALSGGGVFVRGGLLCPEGVSVQGGLWGLCPGGDPPPADRMTDASENITLPQTSFAGGNKPLPVDSAIASAPNRSVPLLLFCAILQHHH